MATNKLRRCKGGRRSKRCLRHRYFPFAVIALLDCALLTRKSLGSEVVSEVVIGVDSTIQEEIQVVREEASIDISDYTVWDLWDYLECNEIFDSPRPIHTTDTWAHARRVYEAIVGKSSSTVQSDAEKNGFHVPIISKQSPGKGRGNFADRDIEKGEIIWSGINTARFQDGEKYREFITSIEPGLACDVLQWAYVQDLSDDGEDDDEQNLYMSVDLDAGSYCNDGGEDEANKGCDPEEAKKYPGGCKTNYFALRDIRAGEELLCEYGSFAIPSGWEVFGL